MAAARNEFIEVVSSSAYQDLEKLINLIDVAGKKIGDINTTMKVVKLPSELNHSIVDMSKSTGELRNGVIKLNQEIIKKNQLSSQEIVNNRILTQNANTYAKSVSTLAGAYQNLIARQQIAARQVQDIVARGRLATQTQKQYNKELDDAQKRFTVLNQKVVLANRAVNKFNDNVGNYPTKAVSGLKDLMGAFGIIGGVTAFASIAKNIFQTTKELQSLDLALSQVTGTQEEFNQAQEFISRVAEQYGVGIQELTRSYTQFYVSAKDKLSGNEIRGIFESISKAAGAMGLSVEQQQGAFTALTQMLAKGTVQAEELRGQLSERLPGAFGILAKSMGVSEQQLGKMLEQGQVLAADVLPAFARELEKAYGIENLNRVESLSAATTRLSNSWVDFVRVLNEGNGPVSSFFVNLIEYTTKALDGLSLLIGGFNERESQISKSIEANVLKQNLEYYREMGEEQAKLQAAYDAPVYKERVAQLKDENKLLKEAIALTEAAIDDNDFFSMGGTQELQKFQRMLSDQKKALQENLGALGMAQGAYQATQQVLDSYNKVVEKNTQLTEKQRKEIAKLREQEEVNLYTLQRLRLETEKKVTEDVLEKDYQYAEDKLKISEELTQREIDLAELAKKESLRQAGDNTTKQLIAWEEYFQKYIDITQRGEDRANKIRKEAADEFDDYNEKFQGEGIKGQSTEDLVSLWDKKIEDDEKAAAEAKVKLQQQIDDYLKTFKEGFFQDLGLPTLFKAMNGEIAGFGENWKTTFVAMAEIAQETLAFLSQNSQAYFDAEHARLDRQQEVEMEFARGNVAGQEEIQRQYEEKKRELRIKEAKAQKEQALFNAIINTAQAVVAALPNIPLSILIGALGAAQIALIAARPLPQYAEGTANHPGGPMMVNDAKGSNYKEMVVLPGGKSFIPQQRNAILNAPKGTKVLRAGTFNEELNGILASNSIGFPTQLLNQMPHINIESGRGISKKDLEDALNSTIGKMPTVNQSFTKNGFRSWVRTETGAKESLNNIVKVKGL